MRRLLRQVKEVDRRGARVGRPRGLAPLLEPDCAGQGLVWKVDIDMQMIGGGQNLACFVACFVTCFVTGC